VGTDEDGFLAGNRDRGPTIQKIRLLAEPTGLVFAARTSR